MLQIGIIGSFFGGVLSLLSPCSALLLPAFFAVAFKSRRHIFLHTFVFFLGLATLFIPLGLGLGFLSDWVTVNRPTMIKAAGILLILFGLMEMAGIDMAGWTARLRRFMPAPSAGRAGEEPGAAPAVATVLPTYSLGFVYGFAGVCSGPLLGAVLTVAATAGSPWSAAVLLMAYALGMAAPLLLLASLWERHRLGSRPWLRGRPIRVGPITLHSTRIIGGVLFIFVGALFIWTGGTVAFEHLYNSFGLIDISFRVQSWLQSIDRAVPIWGAAALAGVLLLLAWLRKFGFRR